MVESNHTIAILGGTGKEGSALALRWASVGYKVIIGSRKIEKAQATAAELNKQLDKKKIIGMENCSAAKQADICVLTVVQEAHEPLLESLIDELQGKILVDATARVDFRDPRPPESPSAGRIAQTILGSKVKVVGAFQNIPANLLKKDISQTVHADVLVCADDISAAQQVIQLAQEIGLRGYYAGGLDNAIVVEGLTSILISINKYYKIKTASISILGLEV
jgi:NADPH-dependent F420 reductase